MYYSLSIIFNLYISIVSRTTNLKLLLCRKKRRRSWLKSFHPSPNTEPELTSQFRTSEIRAVFSEASFQSHRFQRPQNHRRRIPSNTWRSWASHTVQKMAPWRHRRKNAMIMKNVNISKKKNNPEIILKEPSLIKNSVSKQINQRLTERGMMCPMYSYRSEW